MPRIKTRRTQAAPKGFSKIKPTLDAIGTSLEQVQESKDSKIKSKSQENLWRIMQIHHERTRYIYKLYYTRKAISIELYHWLLKEKYADKWIIAKWKKKGYEKLCCLRCIQTKESNQGNTCICRVPRAQLEKKAEEEGKKLTFQQCVHCGCRGCSSTD